MLGNNTIYNKHPKKNQYYVNLENDNKKLVGTYAWQHVMDFFRVNIITHVYIVNCTKSTVAQMLYSE